MLSMVVIISMLTRRVTARLVLKIATAVANHPSARERSKSSAAVHGLEFRVEGVGIPGFVGFFLQGLQETCLSS